MAKIEKGQPGYIQSMKRKYLIGTVAEFGVVIALLVLGYIQTGTKLNWLTLFAILGCLPASKMLVELITVMPHKGIAPELHTEIEEKAELLTKAYDMIITSKEKIMPVDVVVISGNTVCGYTSSPKTDDVKCARHLKEMLHTEHYEKVTVKIFHDYKAFLTRAEGMNSIVQIEQYENRKREEGIRKLILSTSI